MKNSRSSNFGYGSASGDRQSVKPLRVQMESNRQSNIHQTQGRVPSASCSSRPSFGARSSLSRMSGANAMTKRSSMSRQSMFGLQQQQRRLSRGSGMGMRSHTGSKDPRNFSDRGFQQKCIKHLLGFLTEKQFPHAISYKVLQSPTNADFMRIFEFIYGFFAPKCKVVKDDILKIFKQVGYPLTLTKSSMMTIGSPHTWPTILAALNWMIELLQWALTGDLDQYLFPGSETDDFDFVPEAKIVFDYVEKTYAAFMSGQDTFEEFEEKLGEVIETRGKDEESLEKEDKLLASQLEFLEKNTDKLQTLEEYKALRKLDDEKFARYLGELEAHNQALEKQLSEAEESHREAVTEIESVESNKQRLMLIFEEQKLSQSDINRIKMNQKELHRQKLEAERIEQELDQEIWHQELTVSKEMEKLESGCIEYNKIVQQLKLIPITAENANGIDFELKPSYAGYMGTHFKDTIEPALLQRKDQYSENLHNKRTQLMTVQGQLEQVLEFVGEHSEAVRMEENRLKRMDDALEFKKQVNQQEFHQLEQEIEMLHPGLMALQNSSLQSVQDALKDLVETQKLAETKKTEMANIEKAHVDFMRQVSDDITNHLEVCQDRLIDMVKETESLYQATKEESREVEEWLSKYYR